jgi:hypothetical protein
LEVDVQRKPRGNYLLEMKHWLRRSGLISGILAATFLAVELDRGNNPTATCQPLTIQYDQAGGGRIVVATCWSAAPVLGPVVIHYELDLHLVIIVRSLAE